MSNPSITYSSPGLGQSLIKKDPLQGMSYQAPSINMFEGTDTDNFLKSLKQYQAPSTSMFEGTDLDNFSKTDLSFSTGSDALDNFEPSTGSAAAESSSFGDLFKDEFAISNYATLGGLALNLLGYSDRKKAMEQQLAQGQVALDEAKGDLAFKLNKRANLNKPSNV